MKPFAAFLLALSARTLLAQAAVGTFTYTTSYSQQAQNGYVAILDLSSGAFVPQVTSAATNCPSPNTVYTATTTSFANNRAAFVAITANTGAALSGSGPQCGKPDGLIVSGGQWVNWPQTNGPVLCFTSNTAAAITSGALPLLSQIQNAVAGSTTQDSDCPSCTAGSVTVREAGTLLVQNGSPGACPIPKSMTIAPRGAIGLDSTNRYLIILVAAGSESSQLGLQTPDFALLMLAFQGARGVNFDGGGSTVFDWFPSFGVPAPCTTCASMIQTATVPTPNPNSLTIQNLTVPPNQTPIQYTAQTPPRNVYASIGFSLGGTTKKPKKR